MLILLSVAAYTFSLNDVSVPNRFIPSTPARSSDVNANFDTLASRINQNNDTIEQKFIRFSDLESGDSILEKCRIDTARIDHIRSNPEADSMTITTVDINGGTIDGTVIGGSSAAAGTFTTVTVNGNGVWHSGNFDPDNYQSAITGTANKVLSIQAGGTGVKTGSLSDDGTYAAASNKFYLGATKPTDDDYWTVALSNLATLHYGNNNLYIMRNAKQVSGNWQRRVEGAAGIIGINSKGGCFLASIPSGPADTDTTANTVLYAIGDKVGINKTNPSEALDVNGDAIVEGKLEVEGNTLVNGTLKADSINSTKGINCSTINTGFGNFEIGQNLRTTDNVFFNKTTADEMTVNDTIRIGSALGQQVKLYDGWYLEGSYLCTLSGFTRTVTCTTYYVKCGKAVTLTFSTAADTSKNNYIHISTGLMPASIRPARALYWKLDGQSFGGLTATDPYFFYSHIPTNVFQITPFQSSGYKGITHSFSISYLTY